jgi:hypothetical protein
MKNHSIAFCAALLASALLAASAADVPLIDADEPMFGWSFGRGEEFPGAKGSLGAAADVPAQRRPALALAADFTGGGNYVQMGRRIDPVDVDSLSLWVKAPKGADGFTLRLIDGTGQCHQLPLKIAPSGEWQRIVFPVLRYFEKAGTSEAVDFVGRYEKWGGANDSKWHQPIKGFYIIAGRHVLGETKKGEFLFSGVTLFAKDSAKASAKPYAETFGGKGELAMSLTEDELIAHKECAWTGPEFAACEGPWNISATVRSALHSPDNSFCARLHVDCLDGAGKRLARFDLMDQCGERNWRKVTRAFEFPAGTAKARFAAAYYKTYGKCAFKDVSAAPVERKNGDKIVERILIDGRKTVDRKKKTNGHLFLPDETMDFEISVLTLKPLPQDSRTARVSVRDYWGAEALAPAEIALARDGSADGRYR